MNKVQELQENIRLLNVQIKEIQEKCPHPDNMVSKRYKADTGNYDPSADKYWIELHCLECDKKWQTDQ